MNTRINSRGNTVKEDWCGGDRYRFDFNVCTPEKGWMQFDTDQDAHYFGVWINQEKRMTVTYCEGDLIIVECPSAIHFNMEIADMIRFYGEGFIAKAIDMKGIMTTFCQDRNEFAIPLLAN